MEKYNGYYNYNVWNVMSWLDNEYDLYQQKIKLFSDYYENKISFKQFLRKVNQIGGMTKMRSDVKREKLSQKEIAEIRKEIRSQYKEYKEYRDKHGSY